MYTLFPYADIAYDKDNKQMRFSVKLITEENTKELTITVPMTQEAIDFLDDLDN